MREISEKTSNKNIWISSMLEELHAAGHLKGGSWNGIPAPQKYNEKQLFKNTLELCEYVADADEKRALQTNNLSKEDLKQHTNSIERKSMRTMWEFEGLDADNQEKVNKKKKPESTTETYVYRDRWTFAYVQAVFGEGFGEHSKS